MASRIGFSLLTNTRFIAILVLATGILSSLLMPVLTNAFTIVYPPALLAAGLITVFLDINFSTDSKFPQLHLPFRPLIAIYGVIAIVLLTVFLQAGTRTPAVLVLTLGLYIVTVLALVSSPPRHAIILVLLTAILHRATMAFAGPAVFGNDSLFHLRMADSIVAEGSREPLARADSHYYPLPGFHILIAIGHLFGASIRTIGFLAITVPYVLVPAGVIYRLTAELEGGQTPVLAALLFLASDFALGWSVMPQTTSLGLIIFSLGIYAYLMLLTRDVGPKLRFKILLVMAAIAISFVHHLSAVVFCGTLLLLWLGVTIRGGRIESGMTIPFFSACLVVAARLLYARVTGSLGEDVGFLPMAFGAVINRFASASLISGGSVSLPANFVLTGADALSWAHTVGGALFLFFGILGVLWQLESDASNRQHQLVYSLGVGVAGLYFLTFVGPIAGVRYLQPMRFFQFIFVPLAVLAALGIRRLATRLSWSRRAAAVAIVVLLVCFIGLMGSTFIGSVDDPILSDAPGAQRYEMNEHEHSLYQYAATNFDGEYVVADHLAGVVINRHYGGSSRVMAMNYSQQRLYGPGEEPIYVVVRPELFEDSASIKVRYQGRQVRVFMGLPQAALSCSDSEVVYETGNNQYYIMRLPPSCLAR